MTAAKSFAAVLLLLLLTACAGVPATGTATASPCAVSEASMECQIERYNNVNVD